MDNDNTWSRQVRLLVQLLPYVAAEPAVKWKLQNLGRMSEDKHREALEKLSATLQFTPYS